MVRVNITLTGDITDDEYTAIKEKLPQIVQQLGLKGVMRADYLHKYE